MLFSELNSTSGYSLFKERLASEVLEVRESSSYRWFHFGGNVIQSIMDTEQPERVLLPVPLSMLMFLLWQTKPISLLNLGIGGGGFERALSQYSNIDVTSVESEIKIIEMAQTYFSLPNTAYIIHDSAENFFHKNDCLYDVVLCDLFINEKSPLSLYQSEFYQKLYRSLSKVGVSFINIHPESEENLLQLLHLSRKYFDYVTLIEFDGYSNIVMILSLQELPNKNVLRQKNKDSMAVMPGDFSEIIEKMHFIPIKEK